MKKTAVCIFLMLCCVLAFCACSDDKKEEHVHTFSQWETAKDAACEKNGAVMRQCTLCGKTETKAVDMLGHTFVETQAKEATCTQAGYTSRILCSRCGKVKQSSSPIAKKPHTPEAVSAVAPTCTESGYTEGELCSVCLTVLKSRTVVAKLGHSYTSKVTKEASCTHDGVKIHTCSRCGDSKTESFTLKKYTAQELYNLSYGSVCEIHSYNRQGEWIRVGSGFVYTSNGLILTSYSVIEDAYSAQVLLGNTYYDVLGVMGYDKEKKLALLGIKAQNLKPLYICPLDVPEETKVYAMGTAASIKDFVYVGTVSRSRTDILGTMYIKHNATVTRDNVGGPLMNEYGEVVGINTMEYQNSKELNLSVHARELVNIEPQSLVPLSELHPGPLNRQTAYEDVAAWVIRNGTEQDGVISCFFREASTQKPLAIMYNTQTKLLSLTSSNSPSEQTFYCTVTLSPDSDDHSYLYVTKPENRAVCSVSGELIAKKLKHGVNIPFKNSDTGGTPIQELTLAAGNEITDMLIAFDSIMESVGHRVRAQHFGFTMIYK